ncbi:MAG TPA: lipopolysaccharide assembly protein LapA domain-containing protein [Anaerolineales bacterium]|nr:lipopolysaccharide assembly protein LapA domain-containing protein [Anaerolineales bacterium]
MLISLVLAVIVGVLAAYFASNNITPMQINLIGYPVHQTSGILIVSALGLGVLLGILFMLPPLIGSNWSLMRHRRRMQDWQDAVGRKYTEGESGKE